MSRTFIVNDGRTVTLPQGLKSGPGATNMRLPAGAVVTLDDEKLVAYSRFVNGRTRAGDWSEIDPAAAPANPTDPIHVGDPNKPPSGRVTLTAGKPIVATKKEG